MSRANTAKLFWDCAQTINADTHAKKVLKSYYINNARKFAEHEAQVPKEVFSFTQMCSQCCLPWSENDFKMKLQPQRLAKNSKARKLIDKLDESIKLQKQGLLTKKQRTRAKWLKKRMASRMEIICDFCKKKTYVTMSKPKKSVQLKQGLLAMDEGPSSGQTIKKKKKKAKDKTAGLKINRTPKEKTASRKQDTPSISKQSAETPKVRAATNLAQPMKTKNKQQKKKGAKTLVPVVSKTQQHNSLLQLAALLKTQATTPNPKTPQNRLDALLK